MSNAYVTGDKNSDQLFTRIGHWIISKEVHKKLGVPVTAEPGDVWYVSKDGFAEIRPMANNHVHLRYLYSESETARKELARYAIAEAKNLNAELIYTNDRTTETIWKSLGFKESKRKRTKFSRWEKEL